MTKDEALRLALEALENWLEFDPENFGVVDNKAMTAIKAALEAKDEPVAWGVFEDGNIHDAFTTKQEAHHMAYLKGTHAEARPLYATPPQQEAKDEKPLCYAAMFDKWFLAKSGLDPNTPLYTRPQPPQRTWVGLTNEKVEKMWDFYKPSAFDFYVAIESELKAKNAE